MPGQGGLNAGTGLMTGDRQRTVDRDGSPVFTWTPATLAPAATLIINLNNQFPRSTKYAPLDRAEFLNGSGEQIQVILNGQSANPRIVPAGTVVVFNNQPIHTIRITNQDGVDSTATDEINVLFSREALNADEFARRWGSG